MIQNKNKILFLDIETAPNLGYTWEKYEQDVISFKKEWYILSFAVKWQGEKTTKVFALPMYRGYNKNKEDDKELIKELWNYFNEADIIVAHYGDAFDIKKSNARFAFHGLTPPSPYKTVDTKKIASKYFKFTSNKLDDLGKHLGLGEKKGHSGFATWLGCMNGDTKSWLEMCKYNKQDVVLLEKVYDKLLPWIKNHPVLNSSLDGVKCTNCGSNKLQKRGYSVTKTGKRHRVHCQDCGAWGTLKIEKND